MLTQQNKTQASDLPVQEADSKQNKYTKRQTELALRVTADSILRWFRSCAVCGSFYPPIDIFCLPCWHCLMGILNRGPELEQSGYPFPVFSLFNWTPSNDRFLRPFIYSFKGGRNVRSARTLAQEFNFERGLFMSTDTLTFVIPPGKTRKGDHAWLFGSMVVQSWPSARLIEPFVSLNTNSQKQNSLQQRTKIQLNVNDTALDQAALRNCIFIDDVITTGSTAQAAQQALGYPKNFAVWTLVNRPRLAIGMGL